MPKVEELRLAEFLGDCLFVTTETHFFFMAYSELIVKTPWSKDIVVPLYIFYMVFLARLPAAVPNSCLPIALVCPQMKS